MKIFEYEETKPLIYFILYFLIFYFLCEIFWISLLFFQEKISFLRLILLPFIYY